jgi:iron complex transport system permease protein
VGSDNRFVIPASGLVGALLLIGADLIATNLMAPIVLPIGVVTSIIGAPLFIYLIVKKKRK